jgi:lysophospholipase L1-like esterase
VRRSAGRSGPILRLVGVLLLSVLSVATGVAIAELAVRMLDPLGLSYYEEGARYHRDKIADGELIYRHRPGLRARYQGVEVAINELGFRDRPLTRREPGELRIMLLGDSTVFGWGVAAEDTFGASLEHRLGRLLARPVRAVNTGVGSYNTDQQLGVLRRYADVVEPDIVLLLYSQNDVNQRGWRIAHAEGLAQTVRRLAGRSWLYRLLQHARHYGGLGPTRDPTPIDRSAPGWRSSMRALAAVADHCRARKIPFVAMLAQWHREPLNEALGEDLSRVAAAEGFPFVDARPWFDGRDLRGLTNSVVDGHLNAKGLDLLAERTVGFLTVNKLVPPR